MTGLARQRMHFNIARHTYLTKHFNGWRSLAQVHGKVQFISVQLITTFHIKFTKHSNDKVHKLKFMDKSISDLTGF